MNPPELPPAYPPSNAADAPPLRAKPARAGTDADRELLRRMAAGDEKALGSLYDQWVAAVHSLAMRVLQDPDEAEDLVEETFWQAWRQATRYDESRGSVATWLLTIARSRALDRLRARRRTREEPMPESEDASLAAESHTPADSAELAERRTMVMAALQTLPNEQREAMELAYFGGLSQTEIAERTGQPLGTVKTRMRLAVQKLRASLGALHPGAA